MTGIRVTGIPVEVTEKQLKAYFSNPDNGGGPVKQIYYPLQNNSAVVLFESPSVMLEIFKTRHHLAGFELWVTALPRQIYDKGVMEVEKGVSVILSFHRGVIDELQYIGGLKVDFDYSQECYMLKGTWYQLEWALHLLDRTVDSIEGIEKTATDKKEEPQTQTDGDHRHSPRSKSPEGSPARSPSPKIRSNSPVLLSHTPLSPEADSLSPVAGAAGYTPETCKFFIDEEGNFPRDTNYDRDRRGRATGKKNKNKNLQIKGGRNKNAGGPVSPPVSSKDNKKPESSRDNKKELKSRAVSFKKGTDFTESKPRPKRPVGPSLTSGLDVSLTGFGEKQLSYSFELNNTLKVMVVKADITKQRTDGIVSPNTPDLSNAYGVASAISRAADRRFLTECQRHVREHGPLEMAEVIHTNAGGNLNHHVGFILHVVGPHWREKDSEASMHYLVCTYLNCFQYSENTLWMKSLSTPLISAGAYGFPLDCCIQAFFDALLIHVTYIDQSPHLQEIQLVCFDSDSAGAAIMILQSLLEVDRTHSESAALDRYHTGCIKNSFNAKLLKTKPDASKDTLDDSVEDQKSDKAITKSSDDDSDKDEEKKPLLAKNVIIDTDDKDIITVTPDNEITVKPLSPSAVSPANAFGYDAKDVFDETENTIRISNEPETSLKAFKFSKEFDSQLKKDDFDEEDRVIEEQHKKRGVGIDKEACKENTITDIGEMNIINVDEPAGIPERFGVERKLLDDETEESDFSESEDADTKNIMSNKTSKYKYDVSQNADESKINREITLDDEEHKMKELVADKESISLEFQHKLDVSDGDMEQFGQLSQMNACKAYDAHEMKSEANGNLITKDNLETVKATEMSDTQLKVDDSVEIAVEMKELAAARELQLRDENKHETAHTAVSGIGSGDIQTLTGELADLEGRNRTTVEREDFSQSQWSIVSEKMTSDVDVE